MEIEKIRVRVLLCYLERERYKIQSNANKCYFQESTSYQIIYRGGFKKRVEFSTLYRGWGGGGGQCHFHSKKMLVAQCISSAALPVMPATTHVVLSRGAKIISNHLTSLIS